MAISEWLSGAGAFLAGLGGLIAGVVALRHAKAEQAAIDDKDCDEQLLALVSEHSRWADRELGKRR